MSYGVKILLIDDNKDTANFFEPLADLASNLLKATLKQVYTLDEALKVLDDDFYEYQAIILDGKGQRRVTSKTEDDGFLIPALNWLHSKAREGYHMPYVIYSGYADSLRLIFEEEPIYWKGKGEEKAMFDDIQKRIEKAESYHLRKLYPEVFELFTLNLLKSKYEPDIIKILQVENRSYVGNYADVIRSIRPMIEASLVKLNELDDQLISPKYFRRGDPNISGIIYYLSGSPTYNEENDTIEYYSDKVIPEHIGYILKSLKDITSKTCMHHYEANISKPLLNYCISGFIEYIIWFKSFTKEELLKK